MFGWCIPSSNRVITTSASFKLRLLIKLTICEILYLSRLGGQRKSFGHLTDARYSLELISKIDYD